MTQSDRSARFGKWGHDDDLGIVPRLARRLTPQLQHDVEWEAYQRLAKAVLIQAAKDARRGDEEAIQFLTTPNEDVVFWRSVADF